jgi:hypothetical protein
MLNSFAVWCSKGGLSAGTIKSYINSLETLAGFSGFDAGLRNKKTRKLVLKGIENLGLVSGEKKRKTDPLTFNVLMTIKKRLEKIHWRNESKRVIWAACSLGYFSALRAGEMLPKTEKLFDKFSDLLWEDVEFLDDGAQIRIKEPKIPTPGGDVVDVFKIENTDLCPVRALKILRKSQRKRKIWQKRLPVFRFGTGKNLTVSELSRVIKILLKKTTYRHQHLTAKSLRSGLPTDMESRPDLMADPHVKCWGRWRSRTYQEYMKRDRVQRKWIFGKICSALKL